MNWKTEAQLGVRVIRPEYMAVAGTLASGLLLNQIVWWFRPRADGTFKPTVLRAGQKWIPRTVDEWCAECQLGTKQFWAAYSRLKDLKVVYGEAHLYQGRRVLFTRLDLELLLDLVQKLDTPVLKSDGLEANEHPPVLESDAPLCQKDTAPCPQIGLPLEVGLGLGIELGVVAEAQGEPMNLKDVLEQKAQDHHGLETQWKASMAQEYGGFQKSLTGKERAQLKSIKAQVPDAVKFVKDFIGKYQQHSQSVRLSMGLAHVPDRPIVGWALQYLEPLMASMTAKAVQPHLPEVKAVQSIAVAAPTKVQYTPEQIAEMLGKL